MKENKMKPKRTQRHRGASWQGKGVNCGEKTTLSQSKMTSPAQVKPFAGKVFYLDLPSNRTAEALESDIKELGGTVEKFFSKEIKYLVSNKREARYVQCLRQDSPVPSPDSGRSSPHPQSNPHRPVSHGDARKSRSQGQADACVTSRGKSLVERVVKEQERVQMNKILSNALEWGVKILYIDDIITYVQKRKKMIGQCPVTATVKKSVKAEPAAKQSHPKSKGGRISKPFVKVEDSSRHYRPIYLTMPNMPEFNLRAVPPCSPFCAEDKGPPGNKQQGHRGVKGSATEERAHGRKKNRDKKRGGYCECCMVKYENLTTHLQSERHKAFSKSDEYLVVDGQVSMLQCKFIHIRTRLTRPKCSVSSVLAAPGPCGKAELDTTEEQQQTVHMESFLGQTLKMKSFPGSSPFTHRERVRRNCYTYSDRSKHKSLAGKRPSRLSSSTEKDEQAQIPRLKTETAPSEGECRVSSPPGAAQVNSVNQISHKDTKNSASFSHNISAQSNLSKCHNVAINHQKESDTDNDSLLFDAAQKGNESLDKTTGHNLVENKEERPPLQTQSPFRKIQRKVRLYKRKRRKIDAQVEHVKPSGVPDNSMLNLWELFQSSDDMDVEFHGFED